MTKINMRKSAVLAGALLVLAQVGIAKNVQTITFGVLSDVNEIASPFAIRATASSSLTVTFASTTLTVCTVTGDLVTILSPGVCSIAASQAGNSNFNPAASVTRSFNVIPASPSGTLTPPGSPFTGGSVAAFGDFNGDGIPDLAGVNAGQLTVLLGTGSGTFTAAPGPPVALTNITSLAVGDFNGDGFQDIIVTISGVGGSAEALLGNGAGSFAAAQAGAFAVTSAPNSVAVADFNGDGVPDIVIAGQNIEAMLGNGLGGFTAATGSPFVAGSQPSSIVVGDFNSDGIPDIAFLSSVNSVPGVMVQLGNGLGGFAAAAGSPFPAGSGPASIAVADFNGDTIPDLAIANSSGNVTVLLGYGLGGFNAAPGSPPAVASAAASVAVGDFNGDGIPDLAVLLAAGGVNILPGNGFGGFLTALPFPVAGTLDYIAASDFNGDGVQDLAVADQSGNMTILLGGSASTNALLTTSSPLSITYGQSFPLTLNVSDTVVAFNAPTGNATFSDGPTLLGPSAMTGSPYTFSATGLAAGSHALTATYHGDARSLASTSNTIAIQVNPAPQTIAFGTLANVTLPVSPLSLTSAATSGLPVIFTSTTRGICTVSGSAVTPIATGLCSITATQVGSANYLAANPVTQTFTVASSSPSPASRAGIFRANFQFILDANGNGAFDGTGPGLDIVINNFVPAHAGDVPVSGDWNGSGTAKIGIYRPSTGQWFLDYNGNGVFDAGDKTYNFGGIAGDIPVVGDWSGSGFAKIGIFRQGYFWILDYNGNGTFDGTGSGQDQAFSYGGVPGDVPVVGDWSGSGTSKVGVVRPFAPGGTPAFWILDANGDHAIGAGDQIFAYGGIAGDVPVVGDWNGSGAAKAGVFRQGYLWIEDFNGSAPATLGGTETAVFAFGGIAGDMPVTGKWR